MSRLPVLAVYCLIILNTTLYSGPIISFDSLSYTCPTVTEGETETVDAFFSFKNSGDTPLLIKRVLPSCGCTAVQFDTVVQPGTSSSIKAQVTISDYGVGKLEKGIAVVSNAENKPTITLQIVINVRPFIGISASYLEVVTPATTTPKTVFLTSPKKDLDVLGVKLKADRKGKMKVPFSFLPVDSLSEDGLYVFKLDLFPLTVDGGAVGEFEIRTNHPEKRKLTVRGRIGLLALKLRKEEYRLSLFAGRKVTVN